MKANITKHRIAARIGQQVISIPNGAKLLSVAWNHAGVYAYAIGEASDRPEDECRFELHNNTGTIEEGWPDGYTRFPEHVSKTFLGTVVDDFSGQAWHVFYTMTRNVPTTVFGQPEPYYKTVESAT